MKASKKGSGSMNRKINIRNTIAKKSPSRILASRTASHQHFSSFCMLNQCLHWPCAAVTLHNSTENTGFHGFQGKKGKKGRKKKSLLSARIRNTAATKNQGFYQLTIIKQTPGLF